MNIESKDVQERAYQIWEAEGRPQGRDFDHWVRAERELSGPVAPAKTRARRTGTTTASTTKRTTAPRTRTRKTAG